MMNPVKIKKYSGELVDFEENKLTSSLQNAGASEAMAKEIAARVKELLYEGITTKKIYYFKLSRTHFGFFY